MILSRKSLTFVLLTFTLSAPLSYRIAATGSIEGFSALLMWTPGVSALLTQLLFTRGISGLGWRGLLVPELARRHSLAATALMNGTVWAAWHVPVMMGSIWVTVRRHASHDIAIQGIFTPLTGTTELTPFVIDEFGIGLALASLPIAWLFWRRRTELQPAMAGDRA